MTRVIAIAIFCIAALGLPASAPAAAKDDKRPAEVDKVVVDEKTEALIKGALKYLASKQKPNGSWVANNDEHPIAMTGYTLMAFMAAGHTPGEGDYGRHVANGVQYLLNASRADGYITSEGAASGGKKSNMYDHGIATIALAEVYGQNQDDKVRDKLEKAIKLIVSCQNKEGGWRYSPKPESADISVTVLQVVALRAAKNSGIEVPQKTIDNAVAYVKNCYDKKSGGFTYQPRNNQPGFARTAAAIYSLQVCGLYDDELVKRGSKFLQDRKAGDNEWFTYGHFYAAPAQYMIGGDTWKKWYDHIREMLSKKVKTSDADATIAYWEPFEGQGRGVGPVYATAVYTTMLAMPYHYIPLYQR